MLTDLVPAAWIATPVLKVGPFQAPDGVGALGAALRAWDPNQQVAHFIHGGQWLARPESPAGLQASGLIGVSSNQQLLLGSGRQRLRPDDFVFWRPTQSEAVLQQFGDIAVMLKLAPQHTIVDAVGSFDRLDVGFLESLLATHQPSGLKVLPAPLEPAFADQIGAEQMNAIIRLLRTFCSYVVVDTPAYFNDVVLGLIEESDDVLLVAGMDIPNIKNVKIGLQTLRLLNTPMNKIHLILNRANSKVKLEVSEVERTLQVKADALIPSDIVVPQSVNKGTPVVIDAPRSAIAKSLEQLADRFAPRVEAKKKKGR